MLFLLYQPGRLWVDGVSVAGNYIRPQKLTVNALRLMTNSAMWVGGVRLSPVSTRNKIKPGYWQPGFFVSKNLDGETRGMP